MPTCGPRTNVGEGQPNLVGRGWEVKKPLKGLKGSKRAIPHAVKLHGIAVGPSTIWRLAAVSGRSLLRSNPL